MGSQDSGESLPPGTKLLWFEIIKVIGKGGFGVTYLGNDTNLHQRVAIKEYFPVAFAARKNNQEVSPNTPHNEEKFKWGLGRFIKEAQILAQFRHACIVRVISFFRCNNTAYMVMEYVEGEGLDLLLRRHKTLDEAWLKKMVPPLLDGLEILHKADFIHRDIKPSNIMIRQSNGLPVILDFGSARQSVVGQGGRMTTLLSMGYSPFEQYDSSGERQGPWSDIYALAGVLYRAIVGRRPSEAPLRITARLRGDPDPLPSAQVLGEGRYCPAFLHAVDKALMVLDHERPQSVEEWRRLLLSSSVASIPENQKMASAPLTFTEEEETEDPTKRTKKSWRSFIASMEAFSSRLGDDSQTILDQVILGIVSPKPSCVLHLSPKTDRVGSVIGRDDGLRISSGETVSIREIGHVWLEPFTKMEFVWIPGGLFTMGSMAQSVGRKADEMPEHDVQLEGFWMGKYPVTWGKWRRIMGDYPPGLFMNSKSNHPVERVTWMEAQKFLDRLVRMIGPHHSYRLPTEAEWECAARAGMRVLPSPSEESSEAWAALIQEQAWFKNNARGQTQSVGGKKANAWGLHDMLGNVWEWTSDYYQENYYQESPKNSPCGPRMMGEMRVVRGGGWGSSARECWPTQRHRVAGKSASSMLGFRLVRVD